MKIYDIHSKYRGFEHKIALPSCIDMVVEDKSEFWITPEKMKEPIAMLQNGIDPVNVLFTMATGLREEANRV